MTNIKIPSFLNSENTEDAVPSLNLPSNQNIRQNRATVGTKSKQLQWLKRNIPLRF